MPTIKDFKGRSFTNDLAAANDWLIKQMTGPELSLVQWPGLGGGMIAMAMQQDKLSSEITKQYIEQQREKKREAERLERQMSTHVKLPRATSVHAKTSQGGGVSTHAKTWRDVPRVAKGQAGGGQWAKR